MKKTFVFPLKNSVKGLALAGLLASASIASADEMSDLKALVKQMAERIEKLEASNRAMTVTPATGVPLNNEWMSAVRTESDKAAKAAVAAAVAAKPVFSPTTVKGAPSAFEWKIYGRGDIGYTSSTGSIGASLANPGGREVTTTRLNQGEMSSRFGLNGAWVFNADYRGVFGFETGINLFTGQAGGIGLGATANSPASSQSVLFNRGATAGVASKDYGTIEAGTMYLSPFWVALGGDGPSANNFAANDFSGLWSATHPNALGKYLRGPANVAVNNFIQASNNNQNSGATCAGAAGAACPVIPNQSGSTTLGGAHSGTAQFYGNAVRYRSPGFLDGFSAEFTYTNGQQLSNINDLENDGKAYAFNVLYNNGPLFAGYAHMDYTQVTDTSRAATIAPLAVAAATAGGSVFVTRHQVTDVFAARYKYDDFTLGGTYANFTVSNAGGYKATAYGLSGAYDLGKNRFELSIGKSDYSNATISNCGGFGSNGVGGVANIAGVGCNVVAPTALNSNGDPSSTSLGLGYIYNLEKNLSLYLYHLRVTNNNNANLGVLQFRGDNNVLGATATETTAGMFFVF